MAFPYFDGRESTPAVKVWKTKECAEDSVARLIKDQNLYPALARLLVSRGFSDPDSIDRFLNPRLSDLSDPFLLPGMDKAVDRIWQAIDAGQQIVVFGDYDVDGITSTALMIQVLGRLGAKARPFLPHRIDDGYGLAEETLQRCIEELHPQLVITVDCGTGAVASIKRAGRAGVDVVVTDHHEPSGSLAPAIAVVNPKLGLNENSISLAGVGVAFKVCHALLKNGRKNGRQIAEKVDLRPYLDLVGVGTIVDVVPLKAENRILARYGLDQLNKTKSIGLQALVEVAGIEGHLDAYQVGFLIGPRLNAAGRLGDAQAALELLLTSDPRRARHLAAQLDQSNSERQNIEKQMVEEATRKLDDSFDPNKHFGLVLAQKGWHPGVIGIVASRICQGYRRPTIVIALDETDEARGSCRSIEEFHIVERLTECSDLLIRFGGHAMAAGLDVRVASIEAFREKFNQVAARALEHVDLRPVQKIDAWIDLREADDRLMEGLARMRPFGLGNPTPVWGSRGVRLVGPPRVLKEKHLKMQVADGAEQRDAIAFGHGRREIPAGLIDIAFQLDQNRYNGRESLQLKVQDFRASELTQ
jgi:single-stranded-DNA-specific exonuclease